MDIKHDTVQTKNEKTGDIKEGFFVYIAYPKQKIKGNRWYMTFQDSLATIAEDKEITGQTLRVWMILLSELEFENYITTKQKEIATRLDMHQPDVSKAMKLLVSKGIILKVKEGTTTAYKLNSDYGWKGKVSNMEIEKERVLSQKIVDMQKVREFNNPLAPEVEPDFTEDDMPY